MKQKNRKWVKSLHAAVGQLDEEDQRVIMGRAGEDCAADILALCEAYLGRPVSSVGDLILAWNGVRASKNLSGGWVDHETHIQGCFHECGCPLVRSEFIRLDPVQCLCSRGMVAAIFSRVAQKKVEVSLERSIGNGDKTCEFRVVMG